MAAYDLVQHLKQERDPLRAAVLNTLIFRSQFMEEIPWVTIGTFENKVTRWKTVPTPAYRKINAAFSTGVGTFEQLGETVYFLGIDVDVDYAFTQDKNSITDPRAQQSEMAVTGVAYKFNDDFVNADPASDPDSITGIKKRVSNLPSAQTIAAAANGLDVNGSDANRWTFLNLIDQAMYELENDVDLIIGNKTSYLQFTAIARRMGVLSQYRDELGRLITTFGEGGPRIVDAGVKSDQTTAIITNTETQGSATDATSLYFVRFGDGNFLHGIEMYPLRTKDLGERESQPQMRTRVEWPIGLAGWNDRYAVRLSGLRWV